jgi:hypothetical protein
LLPLPTPYSQSWSQFQHLYCLLCCCYSSRNARMKHCCYTNTGLNSYHYYQLWEGNEQCKKTTSEAYLLCNPSPQVNQVMSKADKWTEWLSHVCTHGCVISVTPHQLVVYYQGSWCTYILTNSSCRRNI